MRFLLVALSILHITYAIDCPVGTDLITATDPEDPNPYCTSVVTNKYDTFDTAYRKCWNAGGRLSRLGTPYDYNLATLKAASASRDQIYFYIGLVKANGTWKYADDELADLPVTFTKWAQGEPSALPSRQCAVLNTNDQFWYAMECDLQLPYLCDVPALHEPLFCTDKINADVFFMIDNSGDHNETRMMHDVLFGFNSAMRSQWYTPSSCSDADLKRQQVRVTGLLYYDNTWINAATPNFCSDGYVDIVDAMFNNIRKQPIVTDLSVALDVAKFYTERQPCACRRTASSYGTRQIMIWIPARDQYNTSRAISLSELPTWEHYLLEIKVNKTLAQYPLWNDPLMREVPLPGPWPEFIPTQILRLWRLLCDLTNASGDTPLPPLI